MQSTWFKKFLPHLIAIGVFLIVAIIYCAPALQGKVLQPHDILGWKGMAQQSFEFKEKYGHFPLWSNSMFGGMPSYTFAMEWPQIHIGYIPYLFTTLLPKPICFFFLACVTFYFLCQTLRINTVISIMAAIAYAYSTYDPVIIAVGHETKMFALDYAPGVIAGLILVFQRKFLLGTTVMAFFWGWMFSTSHLQIIYYTGIIAGLLVVVYFVQLLKEKQIITFFKALGLSAIAGVIGFCSYACIMFPLQEYSKDTMRGGQSDLKPTSAEHRDYKTKGGLDKDYAFAWSYGVGETFTTIIPRMYGGSSTEFSEYAPKKTAATLSELTGMQEDQASEFAKQFSAYWGDQPGTSGPIYFGSIILALTILSCFIVNRSDKWWLLIAGIVGFILAWGKNFSTLNYFLFDYLPFYNKFRAPSMSLVIPQLTFPLLAALGLQEIVSTKNKSELLKKIKIPAYAIAVLLLILAGFYFVSDFKGVNDNSLKDNLAQSMLSQVSKGSQPSPQAVEQAQDFGRKVIRAVQEDRKGMFGSDYIRSLFFIIVTGVLIWLFLKDKLKKEVILWGILLLSSVDLLLVGARYLTKELYTDKEETNTIFQPTAAEQQIQKDTNYPFRVFDQTDGQGPFNSSRASYLFNSIGGYSPAKLSIYQDLIERQISKGNMSVLNMLNTRYFIAFDQTNKQIVQQNDQAFGPCWLVKSIHIVDNADEEMAALDSLPLHETAIVQKQFAGAIKEQPVYDSTAKIQWISNTNDTVRYKSNAMQPQFAVLSEIYYNKGWNAYIDGKPSPYVKVNYVLRGIVLPAGNHNIEFIFEPKSYKLGFAFTQIAAIICYLLLAVIIIVAFKKKKIREPAN